MEKGYDWYFLKSIDGINIMDELQLRTDPSMDGENVLVYDGTQREAIERFHKFIPDRLISIIVPTLLVEPKSTDNENRTCKRSRQKATLMISSKEENAVWIPHL